MADYVFDDWKKLLETFQNSVEKDLEEIHKQKAEIQQLKTDIFNGVEGTYFVRDPQRIILSAPEAQMRDGWSSRERPSTSTAWAHREASPAAHRASDNWLSIRDRTGWRTWYATCRRSSPRHAPSHCRAAMPPRCSQDRPYRLREEASVSMPTPT